MTWHEMSSPTEYVFDAFGGFPGEAKSNFDDKIINV